jgi:predicted kinase
MHKARLLIITGLPATGKTTLARDLARRHSLPLICKDAIKEPLLDLWGRSRPSRELSDVSFAIMFALANEQLALSGSLILEGNFRSGEHEPALLAALPGNPPKITQVLCQADETERRARLLARANDMSRHAGHRDARQLDPAPECDSFLDLPGGRIAYRVGLPLCETSFSAF